MLRTLDSRFASSGVMRAAAASGVMLAAASSFACFKLERGNASAESSQGPYRERRESGARAGVRSLGRARGSGPGDRAPAEVAEGTEAGIVALRRRRTESSAAREAGAAKAVSCTGRTAAVERSHSPYHPHLHERQRAKRTTGRKREVPGWSSIGSGQFESTAAPKAPSPRNFLVGPRGQRGQRGARTPTQPAAPSCPRAGGLTTQYG